jgi:shikimate dehydrogenase
MEKRFGLIGSTVSHSFSKLYFDEKFFREGLRDCHYDLYPLPKVEDVKKLIADNPCLAGLNVTIPYKESVMKLLTGIDEEARRIGAVNVIKIAEKKLTGYNTDSAAFLETLCKWFPNEPGSKALILGSGGSSKAVQGALQKLNIPYQVVSRQAASGHLAYEDLTKDPAIVSSANLIVNTTPLGMSPETNHYAPIPYDALTENHYVYDLIYNPARTLFLQKAEMRNAKIKNGLEMLHVQAEKAWAIWNQY